MKTVRTRKETGEEGKQFKINKKLVGLVGISLLLLLSLGVGVVGATTFTTNEIGSVSTTPLDENTIIIVWCDSIEADSTFAIYDTNGTLKVGPIDVDEVAGYGDYNSVSVAAFNSTHFVIGWYDGVDLDASFRIYNSSGTALTNIIDADSDAGFGYSVSVTALNSTHFVIGWADEVESDASFRIYDSSGTAITGIIDADTDVGDSRSVSVAAFNSTQFVVGWYDRVDLDASFRIYDSSGTALTNIIDADTDAGNYASSVSVAALNSTQFVIGWFDATDQDASFRIYNNSGTALTDIIDADDVIGISFKTVSVAALNSTQFVVGWYDGVDLDASFRIYDSSGGALTNIIDTDTDADKYVCLASLETATGIGICDNNFVMTWKHNSTSAVWDSYYSNGTSWNGVCSSPPPPCTTPTISSLTNSVPGLTNVTITWSTNQSADNRVKYSKNSDLSNELWSSWDNDTSSISIDITGLDNRTVYYYQAHSYNGTNSSCYVTEPTSQPYYGFVTDTNDWITRQGNLYHTGVAKGNGPTTNNLLWGLSEVGGYDEFAGPIVVDGVVFTVPGSTGTDTMKAIYINNQTEKWNFTTDWCDITPTYHNGTLYVMNITATLFAIDVDTGTQIWNSTHYDSTNKTASVPVISVSDNAVFVSQNRTLYSYDLDNGTEKWNTSLPWEYSSGYTTFGLLYNDNRVYVTGNVFSGNNFFVSYYSNNGTQIWVYNDGSNTGDGVWDSTITFANDILYTGLRDATYDVLAMHINGTKKWGVDITPPEGTGNDNVLTTPAIKNDTVWITLGYHNGTDFETELYGLYASNGTVKYNASVGYGKGYTSVVLADNYLYTTSETGRKLKCFDYEANEIWDYTLGGGIYSQIGLVDEKLFITSDDGYLYVFGESTSNTYNITLSIEWTIIGWTGNTTKNASYLVTDIGSNCTYVTQKNATTGNYEMFNPSVPEVNNFDVERGRGYYTYVTTETNWTCTQNTGAYDTNLKALWNIIGWTDSAIRDANYLATNIGSNCSYVTQKNRVSGDYEMFNPSVPEVNNFNLDRSFGYLVYLTDETVWNRSI